MAGDDPLNRIRTLLSQRAEAYGQAHHTVETDHLTPEQVEMLRMILTDREEEEMRHISSFGFLKLPQDLRTRLTRVRTKADERIKVMLNESQRMQYQEELEKKKGDPWPRP